MYRNIRLIIQKSDLINGPPPNPSYTEINPDMANSPEIAIEKDSRVSELTCQQLQTALIPVHQTSAVVVIIICETLLQLIQERSCA